MKKLEGKSAFITGANAGLGKGIADIFLKHGAKICLMDLDPKLIDTVAELKGKYPESEIVYYVGNIVSKEDVTKAIDLAISSFGTLDTVCANAGVCKIAPFEEMSDEIRDFHIDVNIKGTWNTCQLAIPYMLKQGKGSIVIASSVTGDLVADGGEAGYAMSKAALVGLTKCLAVEYASRNIRVNCTQLGYARTPMVEKIALDSCPEDPESAIRAIANNVPLGRLAKPEEVGELFAFLASDESSYITGAQIVIDGAATLPETTSMGTN